MSRTTRPSVPGYQAELARKLADSAQRPLEPTWLALAWQGVPALLPLAQAGEIFAPTPLQRLPHTQPWVRGVALWRGSLLMVLDWVGLFGLTPGQSTPQGEASEYWVSCNPALGLEVAFCADRLLGLRSAAELAFEPWQPQRPGLRQAARDRNGQRWLELDVQALAQSAAFLDPRSPEFARPQPAAPV